MADSAAVNWKKKCKFLSESMSSLYDEQKLTDVQRFFNIDGMQCRN